MKAINQVTPLPMLLLPVALLLGVAIGVLNPIYAFLIAGALVMAIIYLLRLDAFIAVLVVAVHILIDSFMGFATYQGALLMGVTLLVVCYLGRSEKRPWTAPNLYWFWLPFLVLTTIAVLEGGKFSLTNSIGYYLLIIVGGFVMFWIGNVTARDTSAMRLVFQCYAMMATLFAIHTLIQALTGVFLLQSLGKASAQDAQFLLDTGNARLGGFFVNPNGNGIFLATSCFIPLGLFMESKTLKGKALHLGQALLILMALMETYSTGSWVATIGGLVIFILLIGRVRDSVMLTLMLVVLAGIGFVVFEAQIAAQLAHSGDTSSSSLHMATWQTAFRVMQAYPWFGVGLGNQAYLNLAEPLRVYAQTKPLQEPDNTYFQWGATCGIPAMLLFLAMLSSVFLFAFRNWLVAETRYRVLFAAGIAALIALSINSLVVDGWTSPTDMPFIGWLIAGVVASPLIRRHLTRPSMSVTKSSAAPSSEESIPERYSKVESAV